MSARIEQAAVRGHVLEDHRRLEVDVPGVRMRWTGSMSWGGALQDRQAPPRGRPSGRGSPVTRHVVEGPAVRGQYVADMSAIGAPLVVLIYLVPVVVLALVLYLAVRFGVSHGMRDARRHTPPPTQPPSTGPIGP